jgi:hypothetical protein
MVQIWGTAMHLMAAATDEEEVLLLAVGGTAPGPVLPPGEDLAPALPLDEELPPVLAHPCAPMAAATGLRWCLMRTLVWREQREGGEGSEIGMRHVTAATPGMRDDLIRQFFEDKVIPHLRRISFIPSS